MLVWKTWIIEKRTLGMTTSRKEYKVLLLFGFIPLYISING